MLPVSAPRLVAALRRLRPDIVHGYLDVANLLAWAGGRAAGAKVVWGIRGSDRNLDWYDWSFRAAVRAGAALSHYANLVIFNSHAGLRHHVEPRLLSPKHGGRPQRHRHRAIPPAAGGAAAGAAGLGRARVGVPVRPGGASRSDEGPRRLSGGGNRPGRTWSAPWPLSTAL